MGFLLGLMWQQNEMKWKEEETLLCIHLGKCGPFAWWAWIVRNGSLCPFSPFAMATGAHEHLQVCFELQWRKRERSSLLLSSFFTIRHSEQQKKHGS